MFFWRKKKLEEQLKCAETGSGHHFRVVAILDDKDLDNFIIGHECSCCRRRMMKKDDQLSDKEKLALNELGWNFSIPTFQSTGKIV